MRRTLLALLVTIVSASAAIAAANPAAVTADSPSTPQPGAKIDVKSLSRDQIRVRILDACMYQRGKEADESTDIATGCHCYSRKVVAAMTEADFEAYKVTRRFEGALRTAAETAYESCVK